MDNILMEATMKMESSIENMEKRFTNVRAGRASASMVNGVLVSYYGVDTPLMQLATISIPEARQICIKPYDKSCLSAIEKAIYESNIGLTPNNNGEVIILSIPPLTEETRKEYVKQVKAMAEEARIALRNIRAYANNEVKKLEITEDEKKSGNEDVQNLIDKFNKIVDEKLKEKENELMNF